LHSNVLFKTLTKPPGNVSQSSENVPC